MKIKCLYSYGCSQYFRFLCEIIVEIFSPPDLTSGLIRHLESNIQISTSSVLFTNHSHWPREHLMQNKDLIGWWARLSFRLHYVFYSPSLRAGTHSLYRGGHIGQRSSSKVVQHQHFGLELQAKDPSEASVFDETRQSTIVLQNRPYLDPKKVQFAVFLVSLLPKVDWGAWDGWSESGRWSFWFSI